MTDDPRNCPLCQGEGKLIASQIIERLGDKDVRRVIESYLAETARPVPAGAAIAKAPAQRNFDEEVHHWNPQMPSWRRSAKE